jgi:hypothetical protein
MGNSTDHTDRNKDQAGQNKDPSHSKNQSSQQHQQGQTDRQNQQGRNDQRSGQQGAGQQGSNGDRMNRKDDSK